MTTLKMFVYTVYSIMEVAIIVLKSECLQYSLTDISQPLVGRREGQVVELLRDILAHVHPLPPHTATVLPQNQLHSIVV